MLGNCGVTHIDVPLNCQSCNNRGIILFEEAKTFFAVVSPALIKIKINFLIYEEIQMGAVAKSYMINVLLICG